MKRMVFFGGLATICAVAQPGWAWNHHRRIACDGTLTGEIHGDVVVETGKSCTLSAATVHGKVTTKRGAVGLFIEGSTVHGCVRIDGADAVDLENSHFMSSVKVSDVGRELDSCLNVFERNLTIKDSGGEIFLGNANCGNLEVEGPADTIHGSMIVAENTGFVEVLGVSIDESAFFRHNTARALTIGGNTVGDDLICHDNVPKAVAAGNTVGETNTCGG